ncbi:MAG: pyridoxamine 5'-phosphate oxidase family protein [Bdellovibrio sp.]|nr:pyridoxamine 5'-phosphate oxidase family protein [Bdellovibrio sp.]
MFQEMRRKDRALQESEAREIIGRCDFGMLATQGADGWPYAIAVNHVIENDTIYFHCAKKGHKLDNIRNNSKVCFSVVLDGQVLPEQFATKYTSACAFGMAEVVGRDERAHALGLLVKRHCKEYEMQGKHKIEQEIDHPEVIAIRIQHLTGKARPDCKG